MMGLKGDKGKPLGVKPTLLVCGPTQRAAALEVVKSERAANGATNINRDAVDVLVTPWLA
jgi:phage major head subunit gpT-like protein